MKIKINEIGTRCQFIDAAKTSAIFLVLFYHVGPMRGDSLVSTSDCTTYIKYFFLGFSTIGVPLFFTINGYLLLARPLNFEKHIFKTMRLYLLTLVWSLITVLCVTIIGRDRYTTSEFLRAVFLLKQGVNDHLWFLFALVSIYLLFPVIKIAFDFSDKRIIWWLLFVFFLFSFTNLFANWCLHILNYLRGHQIGVGGEYIKTHQPFDTQGINPFSGYYWAFVYFIVGGLLRRHLAKDHKLIPVWGLFVLFLISALVLFEYGVIVSRYLDGKMFDTVFDGYSSIPCLIMTLSIFIILYRLWNADGKAAVFTSSVGANTLGIYFLHFPILTFLNPYYYDMKISKVMIASMGYAVTILLLSWMLTLTFKRVPVILYLFRL